MGASLKQCLASSLGRKTWYCVNTWAGAEGTKNSWTHRRSSSGAGGGSRRCRRVPLAMVISLLPRNSEVFRLGSSASSLDPVLRFVRPSSAIAPCCGGDGKLVTKHGVALLVLESCHQESHGIPCPRLSWSATTMTCTVQLLGSMPPSGGRDTN